MPSAGQTDVYEVGWIAQETRKPIFQWAVGDERQAFSAVRHTTWHRVGHSMVRARVPRTVTVRWRGPYTLARSVRSKVAADYGIYAVSVSTASAEDLQYIGRTSGSLFRRIRHRAWLRDLGSRVRIRFGVLELAPDQRDSRKRLADYDGAGASTF